MFHGNVGRGYGYNMGFNWWSSRMGMNKRLLQIVPCVLLCASAWAMDSDAKPQLKLEPAPKEVQIRGGGFRVGRKTKIFVLREHEAGGQGRRWGDCAGASAGFAGAAFSRAERVAGRRSGRG